MQLIVQIIILLLLAVLFIQDLKYRAVHWYLFPLLGCALILLHFLSHQLWASVWQPVLVNTGFVLLLLSLLSLYFSLKQGRWVNVTTALLGWGDILFLLTAALYLSVLNFMFFYIVSLMGILLLWLPLKKFIKNKYIPLAGLQSLLFIVFLAGDWWLLHLHITEDEWLLRLLFP